MAQMAQMVQALSHITLSVLDLDRSFTFYVELLGPHPRARWLQGAHLQAGSLWLCLSLDAATRTTPSTEYTHIAFTPDPYQFSSAVNRLLQAGLRPRRQNHSHRHSFYFLDPDGHKLELHTSDLEPFP